MPIARGHDPRRTDAPRHNSQARRAWQLKELPSVCQQRAGRTCGDRVGNLQDFRRSVDKKVGACCAHLGVTSRMRTCAHPRRDVPSATRPGAGCPRKKRQQSCPASKPNGARDRVVHTTNSEPSDGVQGGARQRHMALDVRAGSCRLWLQCRGGVPATTARRLAPLARARRMHGISATRRCAKRAGLAGPQPPRMLGDAFLQGDTQIREREHRPLAAADCSRCSRRPTASQPNNSARYAVVTGSCMTLKGASSAKTALK